VDRSERSTPARRRKSGKANQLERVAARPSNVTHPKFRQRALAEAVTAYEAEHGEITDDELGGVRRAWPRA
jgi:hypothetical protein